MRLHEELQPTATPAVMPTATLSVTPTATPNALHDAEDDDSGTVAIVVRKATPEYV